MKSKLRNFCRSRNKKKTLNTRLRSDLNAWKKFCGSLKESRAIGNIPANELDLLLSKFFISVSKQNGTEYGPGTLSGFQRSFRRYLHEKGGLINILKDNKFSKSREVLAAKRKNLVRQGKEIVQMPQQSSLKPKKMHYLKMVSSVFRIRNHYKGLCGGFFLSILAGGL